MLRNEGLRAIPCPVLVVEVEDVGRAGLLFKGLCGLELGALDTGFLIPGVDMFAVGISRSVGIAGLDQIWRCLVGLKQAIRRWESEGSTKLQGCLVGGNRLRLTKTVAVYRL